MNQMARSEAIHQQLERILHNREFAPAPRLCAFLRFVVEEELAGRGSEIKEYVIGVNVYRKSESYDPRTDPSVRVDAGKLRARLAEYYETEGREDAVVISIPKGTYVPCFTWRGAEPATKSAKAERTLRPPVLLVAAAVLVPLIACAIWLPRHFFRSAAGSEPAPRIVPLTVEVGEPAEPSLSPDGSMVAFSWNGESSENYDVYVKVVDAPHALRLTTDPRRDVRPAWSPDGRQVAFLRNPGPTDEVYVVSALGGKERRVTAFSGESVAWTADSRGLLISDRKSSAEALAGFLVSVGTGERKQLTFPPAGGFVGDYELAASPDGRYIAFCRMIHPAGG
jgi:hypothetical protein